MSDCTKKGVQTDAWVWACLGFEELQVHEEVVLLTLLSLDSYSSAAAEHRSAGLCTVGP